VRDVGAKVALEEVRDWKKKPLPEAAKAELEREQERLRLIEVQLKQLDEERESRPAPTALTKSVAQLMTLRGLGGTSARLLCEEFFGWRRFRNRRQVGAAAGLTSVPFNSGFSEREQGISKAGNRRVRTMAVQLAWVWLRYQPGSALTAWFKRKFGEGKRARRVGIVALARRLLVAFWRYLEAGVVPEGATLKTT
jgi:transposase